MASFLGFDLPVLAVLGTKSFPVIWRNECIVAREEEQGSPICAK